MTQPSEEAAKHAYNLLGEHPADRVMRQQSITSGMYLLGDPPPTRSQVAAVMHALADFTHTQHMLSGDVAELAGDDTFGGQAAALGRYFHGLGDYLDDTRRA